MNATKTALTRALNDRLRVSHRGGRILLTRGIVAQGRTFALAAIRAIQLYDDFTPDNDPHGEHDFGAVEIDGESVFWKIDYYDLSGTGGAEDPSDDAASYRVLTLMLSHEY